jgi:hypothetical protein
MTSDPAAKDGRECIATPTRAVIVLEALAAQRGKSFRQNRKSSDAEEALFELREWLFKVGERRDTITELRADRDRLRERVKELEAFAASVRDWYENAGNADPDRESPGSRELWSAARSALSKSPK